MATVILNDPPARTIPLAGEPYRFAPGAEVDIPDEQAPRFLADPAFTVVRGTPFEEVMPKESPDPDPEPTAPPTKRRTVTTNG